MYKCEDNSLNKKNQDKKTTDLKEHQTIQHNRKSSHVEYCVVCNHNNTY
jgi:hypothetical protein